MRKLYTLLLLIISYQLEAQIAQSQAYFQSNFNTNQTSLLDHQDFDNSGDSGKYAATNYHQWASTMQSAGMMQASTTTIDSNLSTYFNGIFDGSVTFIPDSNLLRFTSNDGLDVFVLKLDNSGNILWARSINGTQSLVNFLIGLDSNLTINIGGSLYNTIDFNLDSNLLRGSNADLADLFILKLDSNGVLYWENSFDESSILTNTSINTSIAGKKSYNVFKLFIHNTTSLNHLSNTQNFNSSSSRTIVNNSSIVTRLDSGFTTFDETSKPIGLLNGQVGNIIKGTVNDGFSGNIPVSLNEEKTSNQLTLYPNPVRDQLNIKSAKKVQNVIIFNKLGARVKTTSQAQFSVDELPNGVYLIQIQTEEELITERFIKK